ncbi:hypothetical protein HYQ46_011656 [Verticillium longisporum]|nr:hypothetical protein HYQ46_011656 [Verticillium longisporum]
MRWKKLSSFAVLQENQLPSTVLSVQKAGGKGHASHAVRDGIDFVALGIAVSIVLPDILEASAKVQTSVIRRPVVLRYHKLSDAIKSRKAGYA